jgi:hypothetical protein
MTEAGLKLPKIVHQDDHFFAGTFQNMAIAVWEDETLPTNVRLLREMVRRLGGEHPGGIGLVQVVGAHHPHIGPDARNELGVLLKASAPYIRCSTVVFEGTGFRAAAVRGLVAGLVMLSRVPFPHQVFATLEAAVDWQVAHMRTINPALGRPALTEAIEDMRARARSIRLARTA